MTPPSQRIANEGGTAPPRRTSASRRVLAHTLLALMAVGGASAATAQADDSPSHFAPTPAVEYAHGVRSLRDVVFAEPSEFRPLTLDLYLPKGAVAKPLVVFVHGGAWRHRTAREGGTFRDFPAVLASVAARGFVVASVNYRLVGEVRFPGAVQDVGLAIHWLRERATEYQIDPEHVVVWGSSAGGHIAALLGTACGDTRWSGTQDCVQGVIDWYGVIDLTEKGSAQESAYLGCEVRQCPPALLRSTNPINFIDAKDPPFLIQHGTADTSVSPRQSAKLHEALQAAGVPSELVLYPGVSHGFAKVPGGGPDDAINEQALQKVFEFLDRFRSP